MRSADLLHHVTPDESPNCSKLFRYRGARCSQTPFVFGSLDALHDATWMQPAGTIIEIGTLYGAFTHLLRDHVISARASIHTFDLNDTRTITAKGTVQHLGDALGNQLPRIESLIKQPERCFVFCDGGDKEREVRTLCGFLKPGDIVLCHDYVLAPDRVPAHWSGYESQWSNIKDALAIAGCEPYLEAEMCRAMWGCFIRRPK